LSPQTLENYKKFGFCWTVLIPLANGFFPTSQSLKNTMFTNLKACLYQKVLDWSPKEWNVLIGRQLWCLAFGFTPNITWVVAYYFFSG